MKMPDELQTTMILYLYIPYRNNLSLTAMLTVNSRANRFFSDFYEFVTLIHYVVFFNGPHSIYSL